MIQKLLSSNAFALPRLQIWIRTLLGGRRFVDALIGLLAVSSAILLILSFLLWISDITTPNLMALEEEAQRALTRKDIETARVCILRLQILAPNEKRSALVQAKLLQLLGNHDEAIYLLRTLMEPGVTEDFDVRLALAEALILGPRPDTEAGRAHLEQAFAQAPNDPRAHEVAARVAAVVGDWSDVLQHLEKTPLASRADLRILEAIALWNLGETKQASRIGREIEELRLRSIAEMDERPSHDELMATALGLQGEHESALSWVPSAGDSNPAWSRIRCDLLSAHATKLAAATFPKYAMALSALEESLLLEPSHLPSLRAFTALSIQIATSDEAYQQVVERQNSFDPNDPAERFALWYGACRQAFISERHAARELARQLLADPQCAQVIARLAWAAVLDNQSKQPWIQLLYDASLALTTSETAADLSTPELHGRLLTILGQWDEASLLLRQAVNEGPTRLADTAKVTRDVWERLAFEAWANGNRARARALFADAHYLTLDSGRFERNLALCSALYDDLAFDWERALEGLDRFATEEDRKHPQWTQLRGLLKYRLGQLDEANQLLKGAQVHWDRSYPQPGELLALYKEAQNAAQ
jgi:uncharacterized protein HemY